MSTQHTPGPDAMRLAAEWLRQFDDSHDGGEQTAICASVADWLDDQADARNLRAVAREAGVPVGKLRSKLAAIAKATGSTA